MLQSDPGSCNDWEQSSAGADLVWGGEWGRGTWKLVCWPSLQGRRPGPWETPDLLPGPTGWPWALWPQLAEAGAEPSRL